MRIRITDVDYVDPCDGDDFPLSYWGIAVGDEFEADDVVDGIFVIECNAGYIVVYPRECEVLED